MTSLITQARTIADSKHYDRCLEKSKAARIICEKEHAKGIIWAIDNLDDGKQKQWVYPIADLFPTKAIAFEGTQLEEPNNPSIYSSGAAMEISTSFQMTLTATSNTSIITSWKMGPQILP